MHVSSVIQLQRDTILFTLEGERMFGFGKKREHEEQRIVEGVVSKIRPVFGILRHQLGGDLPYELQSDPFVVGYIIGSAWIFSMIETNGKASPALKGLASLLALEGAFSEEGMTQGIASHLMQNTQHDPASKRGFRVADLIIGAAMGKTDMDGEPEMIAAKKAAAQMPADVRKMLGTDDRGTLVAELQDQLFFQPLVAKYGKR